VSGLIAESWIGIFAHPDDEWLAGWPVFQRIDVRLGVIFFVGDNRSMIHNSDKLWNPRLCKVLNGLNIELLGCLGCSPDFFRSPRSERSVWRDSIQNLISNVRTGDFADASIITHNPIGEYGHPDHIEVCKTVMDVHDYLPLLISDLCYEQTISLRTRRLFYNGISYGPFSLDKWRWLEARSAYRTSLHWTAWEWPGQNNARLYAI